MSEKRVYFNKPQRLTQLIGANTTILVAGWEQTVTFPTEYAPPTPLHQGLFRKERLLRMLFISRKFRNFAVWK